MNDNLNVAYDFLIEHRDTLRLLLGDDISTAIEEIASVADFEMSAAYNRPFVEFIAWVNTRPEFIALWRSDPATEQRRYVRFMTGLEASRDALRACVYHLGRIQEIEDALHLILARFDFSKSVHPNSVAGIGNTRRWAFEYQAFVLAYRRALDSLTWGISTYLKVDQSSFRQFAKALPKYHPAPVATALSAACARHIDQFSFVIGTERGTSTRDKIAHRESIQAGFINIGSFGHRMAGGGEDLRIADRGDERRLAEILQTRLNALHECIADILETFRLAVAAHEAEVRP
ncbi:hypothetical protein [Sphingopyxis sp. KK2]|uniref:hypothetical protein n=1 Tax=Sphingopyxis sp. KK2 TaxID=1855727 RepID=UPI00097E5CB9|nr:hypothetical protein [Sphingopyxis sp. KK2]